MIPRCSKCTYIRNFKRTNEESGRQTYKIEFMSYRMHIFTCVTNIHIWSDVSAGFVYVATPEFSKGYLATKSPEKFAKRKFNFVPICRDVNDIKCDCSKIIFLLMHKTVH
jgi:hypothetical protein